MNAQHPMQPAAAPASQPPNGQPQAPAAPADQLFEIKTPSGIRREPLSVLEQRYNGLTALEQQVIERNARIAQLEQQNAQLGQKASYVDELNRDLVQDPAAFVARAERLARIANGQATDEDRAAMARGHAPQNMEVLNQLRQEMAEIKAQQLGQRAVNDIKSAISQYPLFQNNDTARAIAETTLAAMRHGDPNASLPDLASRVHTQMLELVKGSTQASYEQRTQRQNSLPPAPAGQTPGMTAPLPPPTVKDLKNGTLGRRMLAWMNGPNGIPQQ